MSRGRPGRRPAATTTSEPSKPRERCDRPDTLASVPFFTTSRHDVHASVSAAGHNELRHARHADHTAECAEGGQIEFLAGTTCIVATGARRALPLPAKCPPRQDRRPGCNICGPHARPSTFRAWRPARLIGPAVRVPSESRLQVLPAACRNFQPANVRHHAPRLRPLASGRDGDVSRRPA